MGSKDHLSFTQVLQSEVILAAKEYAEFMRDPFGKDLLDLNPIQRRLVAAVTALDMWERGEQAPRA